MRRTERTGPTRSGAWELKIAASRVIPASTTSSYTTSAWSTPYCFAELVLLTFTVTAGRLNELPDGSGTPLKGAGRADTTFFLGAFLCAAGLGAFAFFDPPPRVAANTPTAASTTTTPAMLNRSVTRRVRQSRFNVSTGFTSPAGRGSGRRAGDACRTGGSGGAGACWWSCRAAPRSRGAPSPSRRSGSRWCRPSTSRARR